MPVDGLKTTMRIAREGTGTRVVEEGDVVTVHAKGIEKQTGRGPGHVFYSTKDKKQVRSRTHAVSYTHLTLPTIYSV